MRANTRVERDRETERETGTYNAKVAETKERDRKRTDGFVEILGRGVSSLYYQTISTYVLINTIKLDIHNIPDESWVCKHNQNYCLLSSSQPAVVYNRCHF